MNEPQSTDSPLVQDVVFLAGIFQDTSPGADPQVFDLLSRVVERLRLTDRLEAALTAAQTDAERYRFGRYVSRHEELIARISDDRLQELRALEDATESDDTEHDVVMDRMLDVMIEEGLWPLKDGAQ